jgi:hypothetical protein
MGQEPRRTATAPSTNNRATGPAAPSTAATPRITSNFLNRVESAVAVFGAGFLTADAFQLMDRSRAMTGLYQRDITFPGDLIQSNRDFYISFKFQQYEKRSITNSPFLRSSGGIRLPLPSNLKDNLSVSYNPAELGPSAGAGLESIVGESPMPEGTIAAAVTLAERGFLAGASIVEGRALEAAQKLLGRGAEAASAYSGVAANPYQTILFKNPNFKKHNFSWKLMPRDEDESNKIRDLVRTFQFHMSPGVSRGPGLFFSYPSMVIVSLFPSSEYLYRFKPCVVETVDVNYAAGSGPSFFKRSQAPSAITLSIQLQEIEYWINDDYDANNTNGTERGKNVFDDIAAMNRMR